MLVSILGLNILSQQELDNYKKIITSWNNNDTRIPLFVSLYVAPKYLDQYNQINEYDDLVVKLQEEGLSTFSHYKKLKHIIPKNSWVLLSGYGLWQKYRVSIFKNCLDNLSKFKDHKVKYIRIARSVFSNEESHNKSVDDLLKEGKLRDISKSSYSLGNIIEHCVQESILSNFIDKYSDNLILTSSNCARYFLKYLNTQGLQSIQLNTEKINIGFWIYHHLKKPDNQYFNDIPDKEIYNNEYQLLKNKKIITSNIDYEVGSVVETKYGPGKITSISDDNYKIIVNWEDDGEEYTINLSDLNKYDKNVKRKNLYIFVTNLINNIDLYCSNVIFKKEEIPNFDHFIVVLDKFLKEKEANKGEEYGDSLGKLSKILDKGDKKIDIGIYHNNLTQNIFNYIVKTKFFSEIININNN